MWAGLGTGPPLPVSRRVLTTVCVTAHAGGWLCCSGDSPWSGGEEGDAVVMNPPALTKRELTLFTRCGENWQTGTRKNLVKKRKGAARDKPDLMSSHPSVNMLYMQLQCDNAGINMFMFSNPACKHQYIQALGNSHLRSFRRLASLLVYTEPLFLLLHAELQLLSVFIINQLSKELNFLSTKRWIAEALVGSVSSSTDSTGCSTCAFSGSLSYRWKWTCGCQLFTCQCSVRFSVLIKKRDE